MVNPRDIAGESIKKKKKKKSMAWGLVRGHQGVSIERGGMLELTDRGVKQSGVKRIAELTGGWVKGSRVDGWWCFCNGE